MLVLSRKPGQRIRIGRDVEVVVVKVSGNRIRLGIVAPADVPIRRDEITESEEHAAGGTVDFAVDKNPLDAELCMIE